MKLVNEKEVMDAIELLDWKDVSTYRQKKNGTIIYRLPIKMYGQYIEVGSFQSGYVRRMNGGYTPYQLNKRDYYDHYYKSYDGKWVNGEYVQKWNGKYNKMTTKGCILIPGEVARLRHLVLYCLKNYYINQANMIEDGKFIPKWVHEERCGHFLKVHDTGDMVNFKYSGGQIENLENGDVYVHEQHAYWNKWQDTPPSSVEIIIDGHRYKVK